MEGSRKTLALLTLSSCLLWQAAAVAHFCLVPHDVGPLGCNGHDRTGTSPDEHDGSGSDHQQSSSECAFLAGLTNARAELFSTQYLTPAFLLMAGAAHYRLAENLPNSRELYRLSPSSSPPSSC